MDPFSGVSSAFPGNNPKGKIKVKVYGTYGLGNANGRGQAWWQHHIMNTRGYLEAVLDRNTEAALDALAELWKAVLDWQDITGSPTAGVLMAEHTALFKMLADGLAAGNDWPAAAAEALAKNVQSTGQLFPKNPGEFEELFGEHTQLAGAYAIDLAEDRLEDFNQHFALALQNGDLLGQFVDENF